MNSCRTFVCGLFLLLVVATVSSKAEIIVEEDGSENSFTPSNPFHNFSSLPEAETKLCRYRERIYPRSIWTYISGYYCYNFTNEFRLNFKYNWTTTHLDTGEVIPVGVLPNGTFVFYDYIDGTLDLIEASFKTADFFELWKDCCREAVSCCDNYMTNENINPTEEFCCPVIWDAWSCFPQAKNNTISKLRCSKQAYSNTADFCILNSEKQCMDTDWNQQTNYDVCAIAPVLRHRHQFHITLLAVGSGLSLPAVLIFVAFQKFRKTTRVVFHRNLISVVIVRNILTILVKQLVLLDALKSTASHHVMDNNSAACRVLAFFESAAKNGIYACMLADGFYLHKLIVRTFAPEPSLYLIYGIVAGLTFGPTLIWAGTRAANGAGQCWMVDTGSDQWVSDGFRMVVLAINFILLFDIVRCMIVKRKSNNMTKQVKETFRATLFLIPLFGLHIFIITDRNIFGTSGGACSLEDIYYYVSYSIEGMQSVLVALTFCYLNTEVHGELKNAYRKFMLHLEQKYGWNFSNKNKNLDRRRRTTAATYIDPVENATNRGANGMNKSLFAIGRMDHNNESEL